MAQHQQLGDPGVVGVNLVSILGDVLGEDRLVEPGELVVLAALLEEAWLALDLLDLLGLEVLLRLESVNISDLLRNVPDFFEGRANEGIILLVLFGDHDLLVD